MFALPYQFWSYILSPENDWSQCTVAAILTSKFIVRLVVNQVLLSNSTSQNDCFAITSMKKCTIKYVTLQQFSFVLKICVKRLHQTVNVFHLRLCRLLEEPKRPEGTVPG